MSKYTPQIDREILNRDIPDHLLAEKVGTTTEAISRRRRRLRSTTPTILTPQKRPQNPVFNKQPRKILVLPDLHVPFHDKKAYELFLRVAREVNPDVLVVIGDFADFYAVSSHLKDPTRPNFSREVEAVKQELAKLDGIGARRIFLEGNHEHRLNRYLRERAPEIYGLFNVEELLGLKDLGFEYYPYQQEVTIGKVSFVHDLGYAGVNGTRQTLAAYPGNIVFGHTHRFNCFTAGTLRRDTYTAWNVGWLGDPKKIDYLPSIKVKQDWVKGFLVVRLDDQGYPHFEPVKITNDKCMVEGKLYA